MATITPIIALRKCAAIGLAAVCLTGCGGPGFEYIGHWQGMRDMKGQPGAPPYVMFTANQIKLTIRDDGRFQLQDMGVPKEGIVQYHGDKATLTVTKMAGRDPASFSPSLQADPETIELSAQGRDLIYTDKRDLDPAPVHLTRVATKTADRP